MGTTVLQVRALAYHDTQRYRLGTNFAQLPINRPRQGTLNPLCRDGAGNFQQGRGGNTLPPYYPSGFYGLDKAPQYAAPNEEIWNGRVIDYESKMEDGDLEQPRDFFERILAKEPGQQENLISNIALHLAEADSKVRDKAYGMFPSVANLQSLTLTTCSSSLWACPSRPGPRSTPRDREAGGRPHGQKTWCRTGRPHLAVPAAQ